jgi:hypothetical protein
VPTDRSTPHQKPEWSERRGVPILKKLPAVATSNMRVVSDNSHFAEWLLEVRNVTIESSVDIPENLVALSEEDQIKNVFGVSIDLHNSFQLFSRSTLAIYTIIVQRLTKKVGNLFSCGSLS